MKTMYHGYPYFFPWKRRLEIIYVLKIPFDTYKSVKTVLYNHYNVWGKTYHECFWVRKLNSLESLRGLSTNSPSCGGSMSDWSMLWNHRVVLVMNQLCCINTSSVRLDILFIFRGRYRHINWSSHVTMDDGHLVRRLHTTERKVIS